MIKIKDNRTLVKGQKVRVYRNLINGQFSIQDYKTRLVCAYSDSFSLENVHFFISKKSQKRARNEKVRNVHAYAIGYYNPEIIGEIGEEITYNPFYHETFIEKNTSKSISSIDRLLFIDKKIFKST